MANYADSTRTPRTLTEREQRLLLKSPASTERDRDHLLYAMALGTGLRDYDGLRRVLASTGTGATVYIDGARIDEHLLQVIPKVNPAWLVP